MPHLEKEATPSLILDQRKFDANCERMLGLMRSRGARLRPHVKTLKCVEAAKRALDPMHGGIAVSTLTEAEYFAAAGFEDIQLAVCLSPDKLPRAATLARSAPRFSFFVDSIEVAEAVAAFAQAEGVPLRVWIEVDSGEHRTGVAPDAAVLPAIADRLALSRGAKLEGVATHAGHSYGADADVAAIAEAERVSVLEAAARLRDHGHAVQGVSAGSTPTAVRGQSAEGLTELRAGVYMAGDLFQAGIGAVGETDIALSVLATVISHSRSRNQIVVDAGGLALSKDRSTRDLGAADCGYGLVLDVSGEPSFGRLRVVDVHQEHGEITDDTALPFDALPIGSRVRILPNHACMTAAMYDEYLVVAGSTRVMQRWGRINGWRPVPPGNA